MFLIRCLSLLALFCLSIESACAQVAVKAYNEYTPQGWREILLEFKINNGWHIFAPYEQELGTPLSVDWHLSPNDEILETSYSHPRRFDMGGFVYDGYENKAFYKTTIKSENNQRNLNIEINWQACSDEECLPQSANLTIRPHRSAEFAEKVRQAEETFFAADDKIQNWFIIIATAFIAGIILNLMPCVLPVLGLKLLACMKTKPEDRCREAGFYTSGIVCSMLILALLLLLLRRADPYINWGFQMQNPWFVAIMLIIFIILTLMALEIIGLNGKWLSKLAKIHFNNYRLEAFSSGMLAVLVASPCTAPFMGAAIGYALMAPTYIYFPVFLSLGLGYALPFAGLMLFPKQLQKIMPRPGKWMQIVKKILAIPLFLTCLWLGWLLCLHLGWLLNNRHLDWQEYSMAKVEEALSAKRPVFIDFTADWCITCLVNKKTSLYTSTMSNLAKKHNILLLKADITGLNPQAATGLKKYNHAGVPLYVYYDGKSDDYIVLPAILSPQILQDYVQ